MNNTQRSAQAYEGDPRNADVKIYVDGEFKSRDDAKVSIFDSGFVLGDGVWEGMRLVNGSLVALDQHMTRLFQGAEAISLDLGVSRDEMIEIIKKTLAENDMHDGVHIRLMVTRGRKETPNQDPRFTISKACIVVVAEYKTITPESKIGGRKLFTSTFRCSGPDVFDLRLNSHSRLNLIQALIQAINAGADEALMLDPNGFVASCNSTNFFIVRGDELWTSTGHYNFNGITHKTVMELARKAGITVREKNYTLAEAYSADQAFLTGTLGGITPVSNIDGHTITNRNNSEMIEKLTQLYEEYLNSY
ncbi:aminotransferase class IV [Rhodanobacter aciditrophus]|uniref:branched-chain-amino-acid transaminase n=1 Tax=Rhodanobacter aciditrophus TaxID=1623218 RepID=A0ABW4B1V3_9GAMM